MVSLTDLVRRLAGRGSAARRCEDLYSRVITGVGGVDRVDAECSAGFGGGWQRVDVHLATNDDDEASAIAGEILAALASEPEMHRQWATPRRYVLGNGREAVVGLRRQGFNGVPSVGEVRDRLGIEP